MFLFFLHYDGDRHNKNAKHHKTIKTPEYKNIPDKIFIHVGNSGDMNDQILSSISIIVYKSSINVLCSLVSM